MRCGSCLHIFHAIEHTLTTPSVDTSPNTAIDKEWDNVLGDMPEDEAWVMDLLAESEPPKDPATHKTSESEKHSAHEIEPEQNKTSDPIQADTVISADRDEDKNFIEETFIQAEHASDTLIKNPPSAERLAQAENEKSTTEDTALDDISPLNTQAIKIAAKTIEPSTSKTKAQKTARNSIDISKPLIQEERNNIQIEIEPEPIELPKHSKLNSALTLLLVLLLVSFASLAAAWFYRIPLSLWPDSKPAVEYICQYIDCQLPIINEPLYTEGLVVRPHPDYPGALIMNVRLVNPANTPVKLPLLKLTIANVRGEVLAASAFEPENYLPSSLKGNTIQPANSAVEIELHLVEPAGGAVSYQMETLP